MHSPSINLLGNTGPCQYVLDLSAHEVRNDLALALASESSESLLEAMFATDRRYCGVVKEKRFEIRPVWRNRRVQPTLRGTIEELEPGVTRIDFEIQLDGQSLIPWLIPIVIVPVVAALLLVAEEPLTFLPIGGISLILYFSVATFSSLMTRRESKKLVEFCDRLFTSHRRQ